MTLTESERREKRDTACQYRMNALDRARLRYVEIEYQMRHSFSALTSSGSLSMEWMRRKPVTMTVTFQFRKGVIHV